MVGRKLKPCPKCNGHPAYYAVGDYKQFYIVKCRDCGYEAAEIDEARSTLWGARRLWNRRAKNADRYC